MKQSKCACLPDGLWYSAQRNNNWNSINSRSWNPWNNSSIIQKIVDRLSLYMRVFSKSQIQEQIYLREKEFATETSFRHFVCIIKTPIQMRAGYVHLCGYFIDKSVLIEMILRTLNRNSFSKETIRKVTRPKLDI